MIRQTSLQAYKEIIDNQELGRRQKQVYEVFAKYGELTNLEVSKVLWIPINSITPRTNELYKKGLIEESKRDICPISGRKAIFWRITSR